MKIKKWKVGDPKPAWIEREFERQTLVEGPEPYILFRTALGYFEVRNGQYLYYDGQNVYAEFAPMKRNAPKVRVWPLEIFNLME
ncbi:MAG: hypothetical protein IJ963_05595 [Phascolarctobacterium sp.]|nr:hypothetical protein [Phascolarctobacterium sp.]MBR6636867.1 hypothetical protein [Phascolarctobacterium sp.]